MASITIFKESALLREQPLQDRLRIGRNPDVEIQLEDPLLSRSHAEIFREGRFVFVLDRRSTNGTLLNGRRLDPDAPAQLNDGDVVQVGPFLLKLSLEATPSPGEVTMAIPPPAEEILEPPPPSPLMEHLLHGDTPLWEGGETTLRVADIIDETDDAKTFRFVGEKPILFSYKPGQFITLILAIEGKKVLRSYSLSSSPSRPHTLEITVKRVPGGLVSNWLADNLKLGDSITARGPSGKFSCFEYPARKMLFIAAGSGITPLMSMCRWILDTTADVDVVFFVSARTPSEIIFRKELELMSARHGGLKVAVTLTGGAAGTDAWMGLTGRCSRRMLEMVTPDIRDRHAFMCGPEPFMNAVKETLREMEFPLANLHTESFGGARVAAGVDVKPRDVPSKASIPAAVVKAALAMGAPAPSAAAGPPPPAAAPPPRAAVAPPAPQPAKAAAQAGFEVRFAKSGKSVRTDGAAPLLDLAEANGIEIDYACRTGSCGTCKVVCSSGTVEMDDDSGLSADEKKKKYVLTCVGSARSDVVLDA